MMVRGRWPRHTSTLSIHIAREKDTVAIYNTSQFKPRALCMLGKALPLSYILSLLFTFLRQGLKLFRPVLNSLCNPRRLGTCGSPAQPQLYHKHMLPDLATACTLTDLEYNLISSELITFNILLHSFILHSCVCVCVRARWYTLKWSW